MDPFGNGDWRSQLDSKYSESAEFQEVLSQYTEDNHHFDPLAVFPHTTITAHSIESLDPNAPLYQIYPAIRFPPIEKVILPSYLQDETFVKDFTQELESYGRKSLNFDDTIAGIKFLEAMMKTIYEKAKDIRTSIIENGHYLEKLLKPLSIEEMNNVNTVVIENLILMRDDSVQLLEEISLFSIEKMQNVIQIDDEEENNHNNHNNNLHHDLIRDLRNSLIHRGQLLQNEAATSLLIIDQLTEFANSLTQYPPQPYLFVEGIQVKWEAFQHFYESKLRISTASKAFLAYMSSRGYPICDPIYAFLQHPMEYDCRLWILEKPFRKGEFGHCMTFLAMCSRIISPPTLFNLRELNLYGCNLSDTDCCAMVKHLNAFSSSLTDLRLSRNKITYSGIASLAMHIFEFGSSLQSLYLDYNRINREGARLLAQILSRMPQLKILNISHNPIRDIGLFHILKHCLNPRRKAYHSFPKLDIARSNAFSTLRRRRTRSADSSDSLLGEIEERTCDGDDQDKSVDRSRDRDSSFMHSYGEEEEEEEEVRTTGSAWKNRYPYKCYLEDYFIESRRLTDNSSTIGGHSISSSSSRMRDDDRPTWVNEEEEEVDIDGNDYYGEEEQQEQEGSLGKQHAPPSSSSLVHKSSWIEAVGGLRNQRQLLYQNYPLFIQKLLRLRLKLAAIAGFLKLRQRGHPSLASLSVGNCSLTPAILPVLRHTLSDNHNLTAIDLSGNSFLLSNGKDAEVFAEILNSSNLASVTLEEVGLKDGGLVAMSKALLLSESIKSVNISNNAIGPTGANVIASLCKKFNCDELSIDRGAIRSTSAARIAGTNSDDEEDDNLSYMNRGSGGGGGGGGGGELQRKLSASTIDETDEGGSYLDNDFYEGEESDSDEDDALHEDDDNEALYSEDNNTEEVVMGKRSIEPVKERKVAFDSSTKKSKHSFLRFGWKSFGKK